MVPFEIFTFRKSARIHESWQEEVKQYVKKEYAVYKNCGNKYVQFIKPDDVYEQRQTSINKKNIELFLKD